MTRKKNIMFIIELIFKELKSRYDLDVVNTRNPQIVGTVLKRRWLVILS